MPQIQEEAEEEQKEMELDLDEGIRAAMAEPKPILKNAEKAEVYSNESFGSDELNNSICEEADRGSDDYDDDMEVDYDGREAHHINLAQAQPKSSGGFFGKLGSFFKSGNAGAPAQASSGRR